MTTAAALRLQIEAALAHRIPSALTPAPRLMRPVAPTGIASVDALLEGGLPLGAITELAGPECSGRTSVALSFVAQMTQEGRVCAWVDVSNALDPESAAAVGVDLASLLWVRCGVTAMPAEPVGNASFALAEKYFERAPAIKGLHGGGHGPHPREEVRGLSDAVGGFLRPEAAAGAKQAAGGASVGERRGVGAEGNSPSAAGNGAAKSGEKPSDDRFDRFRKAPSRFSGRFSAMDQALRVTDLLLQAGGFGAIVLDMGSVAPEDALRVPLATWFRYRAAAERTQAAVLLLTQQACAKSSAGLLLHLEPGEPLAEEATLFTGLAHRMEVARERFQTEQDEPGELTRAKVVPMRKPPQSAREGRRGASWQSRTAWAVGR